MVPGGLCEREDELARIDALMTASCAGRGGVLLITYHHDFLSIVIGISFMMNGVRVFANIR